ncbi:HEAT repeat domain-containing protein [Crocosphaera sp.]|uniref:HEAT repeat domain-containing protein n=1 Tax=Crocosphaera sp. TaxID=2729996 RepID=UPI00261E646F|nr:HEAT repeat domain-containing protein [Crocosphaera sp.]MDJ0581565.1 HEAT repeat domain-containing protein [Crocosphaera sp.]
MQNEDVKSLIQNVATADSADSLLNAVESLVEANNQEAIPTLIEVLGYNNPGAAVAAVDGLINLGDVAVPSLLAQIDGYNYGARAWATRALAGIGNPLALDLLLSTAMSDFSLSVRRAAARGLGKISWSHLPDKEVATAQIKTLNTLIKVLEDPEWVVRYAAVVGLENLALSLQATEANYSNQIIEKLQSFIKNELELAVCIRAKLALTHLV